MAIKQVRIEEERATALPEYGRVPIAFWVTSRFDVESMRGGLGGWKLTEAPVEPPYLKDYDQEEGEGPARWATRWDLSTWGIISAFADATRVGGAVIAYRTAGVHMLEGRDDLAVLWDIRIHPECRRSGIGTTLFGAAAAWARRRGCRLLKVETQNNNVSACKFYARNGCELRAIHRHAYPDLPDEVQFLWYLELRTAP